MTGVQIPVGAFCCEQPVSSKCDGGDLSRRVTAREATVGSDPECLGEFESPSEHSNPASFLRFWFVDNQVISPNAQTSAIRMITHNRAVLRLSGLPHQSDSKDSHRPSVLAANPEAAA